MIVDSYRNNCHEISRPKGQNLSGRLVHIVPRDDGAGRHNTNPPQTLTDYGVLKGRVPGTRASLSSLVPSHHIPSIGRWDGSDFPRHDGWIECVIVASPRPRHDFRALQFGENTDSI